MIGTAKFASGFVPFRCLDTNEPAPFGLRRSLVVHPIHWAVLTGCSKDLYKETFEIWLSPGSELIGAALDFSLSGLSVSHLLGRPCGDRTDRPLTVGLHSHRSTGESKGNPHSTMICPQPDARFSSDAIGLLLPSSGPHQSLSQEKPTAQVEVKFLHSLLAKDPEVRLIHSFLKMKSSRSDDTESALQVCPSSLSGWILYWN